jgi:hypothetical protein
VVENNGTAQGNGGEMKTSKEIRAEIRRIKADSRFAHRKKDVAIVEINAPLALVQCSMEAQVGTLEWVLKTEAEGK